MGKTRRIFIPPMKAKCAKTIPAKTVPENISKAQPTPDMKFPSQVNNIPSTSTKGTPKSPGLDAYQQDHQYEELFLNGRPAGTLDDVYEFHSSPKSTGATGTIRKPPQTNGEHLKEKAGKNKSAAEREVLRVIRKMEREMTILREKEQLLLKSSEQ